MTLKDLGCSVVLFAVLGPLSLSACSRYMNNSKAVEARASVTQLVGAAGSAYERPQLPSSPGSASAPTHALCASAKNTVPATASAIRGKKYVSTPTEWGGSPTEGWKCLGFEMSTPQYYMYGYKSDGASFRVTAQGDLNGDGKLSSFEHGGKISGGSLVLDTMMKETDPLE